MNIGPTSRVLMVLAAVLLFRGQLETGLAFGFLAFAFVGKSEWYTAAAQDRKN